MREREKKISNGHVPPMRSIEATMTVLLVLFGDGKRRGTTTEHGGKHDSRWIRQALHFFWLRACKDDSYQVLHHGQAKKKFEQLSMCPCDRVVCEYHAPFLDTGSMRWEETSACSSRVLLGQPIAVVSYLVASGVFSQGCMGPAR